MATIQIADKPTLDAVKALLESSGGVKGYSNVALKNVICGGANATTLSITGKGKATFLGLRNTSSNITPSWTWIKELLLDGVDIKPAGAGNLADAVGMELYFSKSLKIAGSISTASDAGNNSFAYFLIQLE